MVKVFFINKDIDYFSYTLPLAVCSAQYVKSVIDKSSFESQGII